eukprot:TRINITY_DN5277_c1_g1_i2.p1 TRINITY_DN5277_c1_g1~~TRINITY_DN5277_c1_g1_i2.p1  ORF type:complete len:514 (-),score=31.57 TRINITY_DN5277_c1_g1_i2:47-1588(-)
MVSSPTCFALFVSCSLIHLSACASARPHILYFLVDDLGFSSVGFNSPHGEPKTPNIDNLRHEGTALSRLYAYKFCSPTRSSLLSGRLPLHVNQENHPPPAPGGGVPTKMTLISEVLRKGGYKTYHIGKWHCGMSTVQHLPVNRGFDSSLAMLAGAQDHFNQIRLGEVDLWRDHGPAHGENGTYSAYLFAAEALRVIRQHDTSSPMFMYLAFELTHTPLEAPDRFVNLYSESIFKRRRMGLAMISAVDEAIGNVTSLLKHRGMYDNTLIIFSSDNGGPEEHEPNYPLRGHKGNDLEGGVRVVAFVSGGFLPVSQRNRDVKGFMHIADWYATFARLAGVDPHDQRAAAAGLPGIDSLDMLDMILGVNQTSPRREVPLSGGPSGKGALIMYESGTGRHWKLIRSSQGSAYFPGPTTPNGTASEPEELECNPACLFDLENDEVEHHDVSARHPTVLKKMLERAVELDKTYYQSAGSTQLDTAARSVAKSKYGGFWGPWQDNTDVVSDVSREVSQITV